MEITEEFIFLSPLPGIQIQKHQYQWNQLIPWFSQNYKVILLAEQWVQ
jgi:hypothetical protein